MPSISVVAGTRHCRTCMTPGSAPIVSAQPVRNSGGKWARATPNVASVPHSRMAPSAAGIATPGDDSLAKSGADISPAPLPLLHDLDHARPNISDAAPHIRLGQFLSAHTVFSPWTLH